jgi:hypothetical protein
MSETKQAELNPASRLVHEAEVASPARRQLLALGTAICGAGLASALLDSHAAHASDLVAKLGKILYLDPIVLNFAFEMEELEKSFFSGLPSTSGYGELSGSERNILNTCAEQDAVHFEKLGDLRDKFGYKGGGHFEYENSYETRRPRTFQFPNLTSRDDVLRTSIELKETVLFAYHGAVGLLHDKTILSTAAAIAGVEGRHAAVLRQAYGWDPVTAPFEGALTAEDAGNKLKTYGFKGGSIQ